MNKRFARAFLAAKASFCLAGPALAVPIHFDFTGTINPGWQNEPAGIVPGAQVSGGFTFETDRLVASTPESWIRRWDDFEPTSQAEPLAYLNFGGRNEAITAGATPSNLEINFVDVCTPECPVQHVEYFNLGAVSFDDAITADFTGSSRARYIIFSSVALVRLADEPFVEGFDYFDGAQVDPTSIVSLPLYETLGQYYETTFDCIAGACTNRDEAFFDFSIDSVTRGVATRSVPEPGTLGLLGVGLLAAWTIRRRAPRRQQAEAPAASAVLN